MSQIGQDSQTVTVQWIVFVICCHLCIAILTGNAMTTSVVGAVLCGVLMFGLPLGMEGKRLVTVSGVRFRI